MNRSKIEFNCKEEIIFTYRQLPLVEHLYLLRVLLYLVERLLLVANPKNLFSPREEFYNLKS